MADKKNGSVLGILLHGIFLVSLNLFSVMLAVVLSKTGISGMGQVFHSAAALIVNIGIYVLVYRIMGGFNTEIMLIENLSAFTVILGISLALLPVVFFPMHYLTLGSAGSFNQLMKVWPYQLTVNGLCLVLNYFMLSKRTS
jgi:hypothetical protein